MANPNPIRRLLDAGLQVSELTQANAERIVHELVKSGEVRRKDTEKLVRELLENSRQTTERLRDGVREEVTRQFSGVVGRLDQLESYVEQLVARISPSASDSSSVISAPSTRRGAPARSAAPAATQGANQRATKVAAAKQTAATKAAPKQAAATKAAPKQAAATKGAPKRAAPKRAAATKAAPRKAAAATAAPRSRAATPPAATS